MKLPDAEVGVYLNVNIGLVVIEEIIKGFF